MKVYRISKYNPDFRTEDGQYLKAEWTAVSDVGDIFENKLLSQSDYLRVEENYIEAFRLILEETESTYLKVVGLEKFDRELQKSDKVPYEKKDEETYRTIREGKILTNSEGLIVFKMILRENIWCYLTNKDIILRIGEDYYMNIVLNERLNCFQTIEKELCLFIEEVPQIW